MTSHGSKLAGAMGTASALDAELLDTELDTGLLDEGLLDAELLDTEAAEVELIDAELLDDSLEDEETSPRGAMFASPESGVAPHRAPAAAEPRGQDEGKHMDSSVVEELTNRLPTSELIKIIKDALECGRRNRPFTESDLLRTMTFGSSFRAERGTVQEPSGARRAPRG